MGIPEHTEKRHFRLGQFFSFALVGIAGTAVHYATLILCVELAFLSAVQATALGALFGAFTNYILNYKLTFKAVGIHQSALPRFLMIAASGILLNAAFIALFADLLGIHYLLSQLITTSIVLLWNYTLSATWAFK